MAQFDVYPNPGRDRETIPYLLDVQADLLGELATRLVVPLSLPEGDRQYLAILHPRLMIGEREVVMLSTEMAHLPARLLHDPVANLHARSHDILRAVDALFSGV